MSTRATRALTAALGGGVATLLGLMATGRLTLDTGWGRSLHALGPLVWRIDAPRELVFEALAAPYRRRGLGGEAGAIEVLERGEDLVLAAHHTDLGPYRATTVETVALTPPERIGFRHVRGPVPHAVEEFVLAEEDAEHTTLTYRGELGLDWWLAGRLAARWAVVPIWERTVSAHVGQVKPGVEERARRRGAREARGRGPHEPASG